MYKGIEKKKTSVYACSVKCLDLYSLRAFAHLKCDDRDDSEWVSKRNASSKGNSPRVV
jgi:hypothetical protein